MAHANSTPRRMRPTSGPDGTGGEGKDHRPLPYDRLNVDIAHFLFAMLKFVVLPDSVDEDDSNGNGDGDAGDGDGGDSDVGDSDGGDGKGKERLRRRRWLMKWM
ncbi:hypothetical protein BC938DRAFT_483646 [Jimgerdemannia flammicorona]|uniref:Uncharacterized protein n=1 Tax=Jimgerdemannia flammicorona TaxID=994334 RepID=A0A433QBJ9_9FUNG|nr:hypothetical protein BC938DRAFT_483646 [Jimgerdemannia flammicorona]